MTKQTVISLSAGIEGGSKFGLSFFRRIGSPFPTSSEGSDVEYLLCHSDEIRYVFVKILLHILRLFLRFNVPVCCRYRVGDLNALMRGLGTAFTKCTQLSIIMLQKLILCCRGAGC